MCSTGTPASDSSETKLCLSSLGVHWPGSNPADSTTLRKLRRICEASAVVPTPEETPARCSATDGLRPALPAPDGPDGPAARPRISAAAPASAVISWSWYRPRRERTATHDRWWTSWPAVGRACRPGPRETGCSDSEPCRQATGQHRLPKGRAASAPRRRRWPGVSAGLSLWRPAQRTPGHTSKSTRIKMAQRASAGTALAVLPGRELPSQL